MSLQQLISVLSSEQKKGIPADVLSQILDERHPDWVRLSSPYRPSEQPVSLQEIDLSTWLSSAKVK